ncbi:SDR family NAD(P)-dependent oxidoreductase [Larkinella rosea]|uniref:SDR family oxidoreductase n=1 Tax=Larkinella rosea TaxID=2025312 RepID=A0A3P1BSB8_9BACT|nr:SDR family oxidoreductase [Larkinella rosea]RRB03813.1 SDR family oxidoreductase [Larkinella rosea]
MPSALITGAAKGIGRAIAGELAQRKYDLFLIDIDEYELLRTARRLEEQYGIFTYTLTLDLSQPEVAQTIQSWYEQFRKDLTVVVNNAGFGLNGSFEQIPIAEQLELINVNIKALVEISYAFIPILKQQSKAYLLNVGSTTAYQTVPYVSIYAASKAFVVSFTRGLRHELRNSNLSVSCLSPGSTDTDFVNRARMGESIRKTAAKVNMSPEAVAKIAVKGVFRGDSEIIPGFINQVGAFLPRVIPKAFIEKVVGDIYEPKDN